MSLADEGFRFLHLGGSEYAWTHPALIPTHVPACAVDCTDMDDDAFAAYVAANENT